MKEYRKVLKFNYNNNYYYMYLDNDDKHFFLKENNTGDLSYITIEELFELAELFINTSDVLNIKADKFSDKSNESTEKIKIIPKIIVKGTAVILSFTILATSIQMYIDKQNIKKYNESIANDIKKYVTIADYDLEPKGELILDTIYESNFSDKVYIYDMEYLDNVLDYGSVSVEDIKNRIKNNNGISNKFKGIIYEYIDTINRKYPNVDLRLFYENLSTLEVVECDKSKLAIKSYSFDSYGCYVRSENKIYVLEDHEYKKGTWDYQVIIHELSHCLRNGIINKGGKEIKVLEGGTGFFNVITSEALNSLFAISLLDYDELNIAYQLQSNYHKVILDCLDNYSIEDYANHSLSYYAKKLDEFNKDDNYATIILELIQIQYDAFHNDSIKIEQSEYYPIYDYISKMYYDKYLNNQMSYEEACLIEEELTKKIMYDVPKEYNVDINHFYDYFNNYCKNIGIVNTKIR